MKEDNILVSVVVPTYNHEKFISETLESIISQDAGFRFEIIIGDDGSKDETRNIINEYASNYPEILVPVIRERNIGAQHNLNDLYLRARGKYISIQDGDDTMYPGKLKKQVFFMESSPGCGSVYHNLDLVKNGEVFGQYCSKDSNHEYYSIDDFVERGTFLPHSSKMFRRELLPPGGFPVFPELRGLDWLHHMYTSRSMAICYIDEVLGCYRKHENSITASICKGWLEQLYYGHEKAQDYAKKAGVNKRSLEVGRRTFALSNLRKGLAHNDFRFYKTVIKELKKYNINLSIKDYLQFYFVAENQFVFYFRGIIFKCKNRIK